MLFRAIGCVAHLEDEWYVVIKAYKFTIFVLSYLVCPYYPTYRVYQLYDVAIQCSNNWKLCVDHYNG